MSDIVKATQDDMTALIADVSAKYGANIGAAMMATSAASMVADYVKHTIRLESALRDAIASIELQASTAEHYAKTRDTEANLALATELRRNVALYRAALEYKS